MTNPPFSDKPPSRAERLMQAALAAERAAEPGIEQAAAPIAAGPAGRARTKSGARARALNRRIREVLREQEAAVYSQNTIGEPEPAPPGLSEEAMSADAVPPPLPPSAAPHSYDTLPNEVPKYASGGSWEEVANEVLPSGLTRPRRGLATGAMRGPALPGPEIFGPELTRSKAPTHPAWYACPEAPRAILCDLPAPHEPLITALRGEEKWCEVNGPHLLIERDAAHYDDAFIGLKERLQKVLLSECFVMLSGCDVEDLLFVDIETAGLSSSQPLFLIGALRLDGTPRLNLFLARDYPEEKAALAAFHQVARGKRLITFNGKSFDWPYIEGRSISYRLQFERPRAHFDLLHHARRTWKHSLPNCKLQTLELYLCGRTRIDDVPGSQIPAAYHEFVATHAATGCGAHLMAPILHHNALDILTMAELVCKAGEA